jgi:hypothetical protein
MFRAPVSVRAFATQYLQQTLHNGCFASFRTHAKPGCPAIIQQAEEVPDWFCTTSFGPGKELKVLATSPLSVHVHHGALESISVALMVPRSRERFSITDDASGLSTLRHLNKVGPDARLFGRPASRPSPIKGPTIYTIKLDAVVLSFHGRQELRETCASWPAAVAEAAATHESGELHAWIPERFCSVDIVTKGGPVTLQGLTEAILTVNTSGGNLHAGKVKAIATKLATHGGSLSGTVTAGGTCSPACVIPLNILLWRARAFAQGSGAGGTMSVSMHEDNPGYAACPGHPALVHSFFWTGVFIIPHLDCIVDLVPKTARPTGTRFCVAADRH